MSSRNPEGHRPGYWKKHPESLPPKPKRKTAEPKKRTFWADFLAASRWIWRQFFDWASVAWLVATVCIAGGYVMAQERMFSWAYMLFGIGTTLLFLKTTHEAAKNTKRANVRRTITIISLIAYAVLYVLACTWLRADRSNYLHTLSRADLHVDQVTVEVLGAQQIGMVDTPFSRMAPMRVAVHITGHNQSFSTPTEPYPMVRAAMAVRPILTAEEERELFTRGKWANETYVGFPYVLNPQQEFSFSKQDSLVTIDSEGVKTKDAGDVFFGVWNALQRQEVVLYVVTRAVYADKWGRVPESRSCRWFSAEDNFKSPRTCAGQFKIGTYQP